MQKHALAMMILALAVFPLALVGSGCGGSSGSSSATGDLTVTVLWPEGERTIPAETTRIHLTVSGEGLAELQEADIVRPADTYTFSNMPVGAKSLTAQAYDSGGTWLAAGAWFGQILSGQTTQARVTLAPSEVAAYLQALADTPPYTLVQLEEVFDWFEAAVASSPGDPGANLGWAVSKLMLESERIAERYGILVWPIVIGPYVEEEWWMRATEVFPSRDVSQRIVLTPLSSNLALLPENKRSRGFPSVDIPGTMHTTLDAYNDLVGLISILEEAIAHLQTAEAQSGLLFTLMVTPETESWELPQEPYPVTFYSAEVKALEGVVQALRAVLYIVSSREWDWGTYSFDPDTFEPANMDADQDGVLTPAEWLPADPFVNLMGDGNIRLGNALSALQRAAALGTQVVDEVVSTGDVNEPLNDSVGNPTWAADMDLIRQDFVEAQTALAGQTDLLMSSMDFWVDAGGGYWYEVERNVIVTLNVPAFFNSPVQDLKEAMPNLGYWGDPYSPGHFNYAPIATSWPDRSFNGLLVYPEQLEGASIWGPPTIPPPGPPLVTVRGVVQDAITAAPVYMATVYIGGEPPVQSGWDGWFTVADVEGAYVGLWVEHPDYNWLWGNLSIDVAAGTWSFGVQTGNLTEVSPGHLIFPGPGEPGALVLRMTSGSSVARDDMPPPPRAR